MPTEISISLRPWPARFRLLLIATALVVCVLTSIYKPLPETRLGHQEGKNDIALYRAEVERIHRGESYYDAAKTELVERGYPTKSVFNWRTPLPMWLLGQLPDLNSGKFLLGGLAFCLLCVGFAAVAREEEGRSPKLENSYQSFPYTAIGFSVLLIGPLLFTVLGDLLVMPVLWAGILIALSLSFYGIDRPGIAVFCGLAAVFVRELALPYCLLMFCFAAAERRWKEVLWWAMGFAAWAVFFGVHAQHVLGMIPPDAHAHEHGWLRYGSLSFVLATARMNAYLMALPYWTTAVYLVAALVGFSGADGPWRKRLSFTACGYLLGFAFVGQEFNQYWGSLIAPLLCFGAARCPHEVSKLVRASAS